MTWAIIFSNKFFHGEKLVLRRFDCQVISLDQVALYSIILFPLSILARSRCVINCDFMHLLSRFWRGGAIAQKLRLLRRLYISIFISTSSHRREQHNGVCVQFLLQFFSIRYLIVASQCQIDWGSGAVWQLSKHSALRLLLILTIQWLIVGLYTDRNWFWGLNNSLI